MEKHIEDGIVFLIVSCAAFFALRSAYRKFGAKPLSAFFLRRGQVALAMRLRAQAKPRSTCEKDCACD